MMESRKTWWEQDEQKRKEAEELKDEILNKFWEVHVTNSSETYSGGLKNFIKGNPPIGVNREDWSAILDDVDGKLNSEYPAFDNVILNKNKEQFDYLFKHVKPVEVLKVDEGEGFGIAAKKKESHVQLHKKSIAITLSSSDIETINQYMKDANMSSVVSISSNNHSSTISTKGNDGNSIFSIHSVGKIMTGVLVILFLEKGILKKEDLTKIIQINPELMKKLEDSHPLIAAQLKKVTLHEVMIHQGGFVDYMAGYVRAVNSEKKPYIEKISDFLPFAKDQVTTSAQYSNLGSLFVGLALEHAYEKYQKEHQDPQSLNFYSLVREFIQKEAGMDLIERAPEDAKVNLNNKIEEPTPEAPYLVASPCGGFWTSANDLRKFGEWLYKKCKDSDRKDMLSFMNLVNQYGQEFYDNKTNVIAHPGENPSASAMLSVSLDTGTVIATLSNSSRTDAHDLEAAIKRNLFTQEIALDKELNPTGSTAKVAKKLNILPSPISEPMKQEDNKNEKKLGSEKETTVHTQQKPNPSISETEEKTPSSTSSVHKI